MVPGDGGDSIARERREAAREGPEDRGIAGIKIDEIARQDDMIGAAVGFGSVALLAIVGNAMTPLLYTLKKQEGKQPF